MVYRRLSCAFALVLYPASAIALEVCDLPPRYGLSASAQAIVRAACNEHRLWYRPFIDGDGRIASLAVTEAENESLADEGVIAWQRVAGYWRESGTLAALGAISGAQSCPAAPGNRYTDSDCRSFLIDNPWSAAFISWVMSRAGVIGFKRSPRHIDYIRSAHQNDASSPYRLIDPATGKPAPGDMLCFLRRRNSTVSYSGLVEALDNGSAGNWKSHCEIVVAANAGGDRTLHLIGGNVANTVMMRQLPLDRTGVIELPLPQDSSVSRTASPECLPGREEECNFNRQDWAALLKLVAQPPPAATTHSPPATSDSEATP